MHYSSLEFSGPGFGSDRAVGVAVHQSVRSEFVQHSQQAGCGCRRASFTNRLLCGLLISGPHGTVTVPVGSTIGVRSGRLLVDQRRGDWQRLPTSSIAMWVCRLSMPTIPSGTMTERTVQLREG